MKLGIIGIKHFYVVDLENKSMVEEAEEALLEDLMHAYKFDELCDYIGVIENLDLGSLLKEENIPEFLREQEEK